MTPRSGGPKPLPVAVAIEGNDRRVDYHFPVEIHIDEPAERIDLQRIAEHVYERLARRLNQDG